MPKQKTGKKGLASTTTSAKSGVSKQGKVTKVKNSVTNNKLRRQLSQAKMRTHQRQVAGRVVTRSLSTSAVQRYRATMASNSGATPSQKKKASETMGENGALEFLKEESGMNLTLTTPTSAAPFTLSLTPNVAWPTAVAFNGANVVDVAHWDGATLRAVEAKGGGSALKKGFTARKQKYDPDTGAMTSLAMRQSASPTTLDQGSFPYLVDIAHGMLNSKVADGRAAAGRIILDAIDNQSIEYVPVSTKIEQGDTDATVTVMDPDY